MPRPDLGIFVTLQELDALIARIETGHPKLALSFLRLLRQAPRFLR